MLTQEGLERPPTAHSTTSQAGHQTQVLLYKWYHRQRFQRSSQLVIFIMHWSLMIAHQSM